jgi:hypothetical protein
MKGKQKIICDSCGRLSDYASSVKARPVEGLPEITEIGIECPHCEVWAHSQFDGPRLEEFRSSLREAQAHLEALRGSLDIKAVEKAVKDFNRAKKRMSVEHKRFNDVYRKKLGVVAPLEAKKNG